MERRWSNEMKWWNESSSSASSLIFFFFAFILFCLCNVRDACMCVLCSVFMPYMRHDACMLHKYFDLIWGITTKLHIIIFYYYVGSGEMVTALVDIPHISHKRSPSSSAAPPSLFRSISLSLSIHVFLKQKGPRVVYTRDFQLLSIERKRAFAL